MSKLNVMPSPKEDKPAFLQNAEDGENGSPMPYSDSGSDPAVSVKRKRNFEVVDTHALYALYPQFFKLVPDYAKIRQAIKLGLPLPGVIFDDGTGNEPQDDSQSQQYQGE